MPQKALLPGSKCPATAGPCLPAPGPPSSPPPHLGAGLRRQGGGREGRSGGLRPGRAGQGHPRAAGGGERSRAGALAGSCCCWCYRVALEGGGQLWPLKADNGGCRRLRWPWGVWLSCWSPYRSESLGGCLSFCLEPAGCCVCGDHQPVQTPVDPMRRSAAHLLS